MGGDHNGTSTGDVSLQRVTVPFLAMIAVVVTIGGGFYWLATLEQNVKGLLVDHASVEAATVAITTIQTELASIRSQAAQIPINTSRLTRVEAQIDALRADIERMEATLLRDSSPRPGFVSP